MFEDMKETYYIIAPDGCFLDAGEDPQAGFNRLLSQARLRLDTHHFDTVRR